MTNKVTRANSGAWSRSAIQGFGMWKPSSQLGHDRIDDWSVAQNYRSDLMRKDDPVIFWVVGSKNDPITYPGLWGTGRLVGEAQWDPSGPLEPENILDQGVIPFDTVGRRDRRIRLQDVIAFEAKRQHDRRELAERFAAQQAAHDDAVDEIAALLA